MSHESTRNNQHRDPETPHELLHVEARLDDLAARDRASAPAGIEDRLFSAMREATMRADEHTAIVARIGGSRPGAWLRIAAAVGLTIGAALIAFTVAGPRRTAPQNKVVIAPPRTDPAVPVDAAAVEAELAAFLASVEQFGTSEISSDLAEAESISEGFWSPSDGWMEESL